MKYRVPRRSFIPKLTDGFIENFYVLFKIERTTGDIHKRVLFQDSRNRLLDRKIPDSFRTTSFTENHSSNFKTLGFGFRKKYTRYQFWDN